MAGFPPDLIGLIDATREVEIETSAGPEAPVHRTIIWIVVNSGEVFARSVRGASARWYREAIGVGRAALHLGSNRVDVIVLPARDPDSVRRTNEGLIRKYQGSPSVPSMLSANVLDTTIRLDPA